MVRPRRQHEIRIASQTSFRTPRKKIRELIEFIARREKARLVEIDIAVVDDREIARLNREYLAHAGPTDVITFDLSEDPFDEDGVSGQIVVCADVARREADRRGHGPQRELLLYIAHGLLHLLDYDDQADDDAQRMYARQEELLGEFLDQ